MRYPEVTRVTVVGPYGTVVEAWDCANVHVEIQDDGRTLKLFYHREDPDIWAFTRNPLTDTDEGVK